jgi:hypothetical protein
MEVTTDPHTEVWKGQTFHDLLQIRIGDGFSARCGTDENGKLGAEAVWLNIINFPGGITKLGGDGFEMLTNPNADPHSAYEKKTLKVVVDANTEFDDGAKGGLKVGREIQMVGLDLKNGTVRATRLTVYEGNRPVRMGDPKVMPLPGSAN